MITKMVTAFAEWGARVFFWALATLWYYEAGLLYIALAYTRLHLPADARGFLHTEILVHVVGASFFALYGWVMPRRQARKLGAHRLIRQTRS